MALPGMLDMRRPALEWAMGRRGYLSAELKEHLAELFKLTSEELAMISSEGVSVFSSNVDWVTAHFTKTGIHTSIDGRHRKPNDRYYLTRYGYAVGEGKVQWPRKQGGDQFSHGPRGALPDARQLADAEGEAAR